MSSSTKCPHLVFDRNQYEIVPLCRNFLREFLQFFGSKNRFGVNSGVNKSRIENSRRRAVSRIGGCIVDQPDHCGRDRLIDIGMPRLVSVELIVQPDARDVGVTRIYSSRQL